MQLLIFKGLSPEQYNGISSPNPQSDQNSQSKPPTQHLLILPVSNPPNPRISPQTDPFPESPPISPSTTSINAAKDAVRVSTACFGSLIPTYNLLGRLSTPLSCLANDTI